jgi:hypothetical protein
VGLLRVNTMPDLRLFRAIAWNAGVLDLELLPQFCTKRPG